MAIKKRGRVFKDRAGERVGHVLILSYAGNRMWLCRCDCGNEKTIYSSNLSQIKYPNRWCGCKIGVTHGMSRNPKTRAEYRIMERMIKRCSPNSPYKADYFNRGITVCQEWSHPSKFPEFYKHVGARPSKIHSIGRIDNDKGYKPGNVRWETKTQQQRNTRNNVLLTYNGETLCRKEMAIKYGIPDYVLKKRVKNGWTLEEALKTPIIKKYSHPWKKKNYI